MTWETILGDCIVAMKAMEPNSVTAVVCDPPYGIEFMGKEFDTFKSGKNIAGGNTGEGTPYGRDGALPAFYQLTPEEMKNFQVWSQAWAAEALRVVKPGGVLLAFGGSRTFHRLTCAIEDAGWSVRDCLSWVYASGFPKSYDISKGLDKAAGETREVVGYQRIGGADGASPTKPAEPVKVTTRNCGPMGLRMGQIPITAPATAEAKEWDGWGTALKPAWEPIVLAVKPLDGTYAENVQRWGVGGLNIDRCRIGLSGGTTSVGARGQPGGTSSTSFPSGFQNGGGIVDLDEGRWPANLILDDFAAEMLDEQSGIRKSGAMRPTFSSSMGYGGGKGAAFQQEASSGGASRFFYVAKPTRAEKSIGLNDTEIVLIRLSLWDDEASTWAKEDREVMLRVDLGISPPRVIGEYMTQSSAANVWNTVLFGSESEAPSLMGFSSIIPTETSSITESRTLSWLHRSITSASMEAPNSETGSGSSPAGSVGESTLSIIITSESMASRLGVGPAVSKMRLRISGNAGPVSGHPTVKPINLMRHLVRLVTMPKGTRILDPFLGSGTTGIACVLEGIDFVGIEMDPDYMEIARRRIAWAEAHGDPADFTPPPSRPEPLPGTRRLDEWGLS